MGELWALILLAAVFETVDAGLGMMYGTLLTPLLIVLHRGPAEVVPCVLISQAIGGSVGAIFHHRFGNGNFRGITEHTKVAGVVVMSGVFAVICGVSFASFVPDILMKIYIGALATLMGIFCLHRPTITFKWWKVGAIGFLASFNKSATGGGFGPLCSTGMILGGMNSRAGVAVTTLSEVPLCLISFVTYMALSGQPNIPLLSALSVGSLIGGIAGPYICSKVNLATLQRLVGLLAIISGILLVLKALKLL